MAVTGESWSWLSIIDNSSPFWNNLSLGLSFTQAFIPCYMFSYWAENNLGWETVTCSRSRNADFLCNFKFRWSMARRSLGGRSQVWKSGLLDWILWNLLVWIHCFPTLFSSWETLMRGSQFLSVFPYAVKGAVGLGLVPLQLLRAHTNLIPRCNPKGLLMGWMNFFPALKFDASKILPLLVPNFQK